jgi:L-lactate permease
VTAIVVIGVLTAVVVGLSIVFGGPILAAILGAAIIVGGIVWFIAAGGSKTTAGEAARETHEHEFLGPGGPDDPTA